MFILFHHNLKRWLPTCARHLTPLMAKPLVNAACTSTCAVYCMFNYGYSQESIAALRLKPNSSQETETAAQELRATIEGVTQQTHQLKAQLSRARALDRKQLTTLTVQSSAAAKQLQGIISKVSISPQFPMQNITCTIYLCTNIAYTISTVSSHSNFCRTFVICNVRLHAGREDFTPSRDVSQV